MPLSCFGSGAVPVCGEIVCGRPSERNGQVLPSCGTVCSDRSRHGRPPHVRDAPAGVCGEGVSP